MKVHMEMDNINVMNGFTVIKGRNNWLLVDHATGLKADIEKKGSILLSNIEILSKEMLIDIYEQTGIRITRKQKLSEPERIKVLDRIAWELKKQKKADCVIYYMGGQEHKIW